MYGAGAVEVEPALLVLALELPELLVLLVLLALVKPEVLLELELLVLLDLFSVGCHSANCGVRQMRTTFCSS